MEKEILKHDKILFKFAIKLTKNPDLAKDLVQETMYKAFLHKEQFTEGSNIAAWLYMILKNSFINHYRISNRRYTILRDQIFPSIDIFKNEVTSNLEVREIFKAIDRLQPSCKKVILLREQGYKYEEIAAMTNKKIGTVKSLISQARNELRKSPIFQGL